MKVVCEHCKESFELIQDDLKEKYLGAMVSEVYFNCPHCKKKFIVCLKNPKTRELQRRIDELKEIIRTKLESNRTITSEEVKIILEAFIKTNNSNFLNTFNKRDIAIPEVLELQEVVRELKKEMNRLSGKT